MSEIDCSPRQKLLVSKTCFFGAITIFVFVGCNFQAPVPQFKANPRRASTEIAAPVPPLQVGEQAPDFTLRDLDGRPASLSDYRGRIPVLIEFGSLSCPIVTGRTGRLDKLAEHYQGRAQFWFLYGNEEHPGRGETRGSSYGAYLALPQVKDYDDRRERARVFRDTVKISRRMLVDEDGPDSVAARYSIRGHAFVIVDIRGRISWVGDAPRSQADLDALLLGPDSDRASAPGRQDGADAQAAHPPAVPRPEPSVDYSEHEVGQRGYDSGTVRTRRR